MALGLGQFASNFIHLLVLTVVDVKKAGYIYTIGFLFGYALIFNYNNDKSFM